MEKIIMKTEDIKALKACAAGPKDGRYMLEGLNITPDYVESTDGQIILRIRRGDNISVSNNAIGVYKISAITKIGGGISEAILEKIEGEYPNTTAVIPPRGKEADEISILISSDKKEVVNLSTAIIKLYNHTGNAYSGHLLSRLAPLNLIWNASKAEKDKPVRLDGSEGYNVVIAPFSLIK